VKSVAFLTSQELAALTDDDRLAIPELEARGARVSPLVWTDARAAEDARAFDLVVVRSPWDWQTAPARFAAVLDAIPRLENRSASKWLDKRYLLELAARGVRTIPTEVIAAPEKVAECKYPRAVLKPALGAGGHRTFSFAAAEWPRVAAAAGAGPFLLQPFVEEVETEGEWSLVFFDGVYSHAVRKRAARGEFRVHVEWGGSVEIATPPASFVDEARRVLDAAGETFLFARVDGIPTRAGFVLTELEVVEPELFLRAHPDAPARFADAVATRLAE